MHILTKLGILPTPGVRKPLALNLQQNNMTMENPIKRTGSSLVYLLMLTLIITSCGEDELSNVDKTSAYLNGLI